MEMSSIQECPDKEVVMYEVLCSQQRQPLCFPVHSFHHCYHQMTQNLHYWSPTLLVAYEDDAYTVDAYTQRERGRERRREGRKEGGREGGTNQ